MWTPTTEKKFGVAVADFFISTVPDCLKLRLGDAVQILEECADGWLRGFLLHDKSNKGIFPSSYVEVKAHLLFNPGPFEAVARMEDDTATEISNTIREWVEPMKNAYVCGDSRFFAALQKTIQELISLRKELLAGASTRHRIMALKHRATSLIDWGNKKLDFDLVPRKDSLIVNSDDVSLVELYQLHRDNEEKANHCNSAVISLKPPISCTNTNDVSFKTQDSKVSVNQCHVYVRCKGLDISVPFFPSDTFQVELNLYDAGQSTFLHERTVIGMLIPNKPSVDEAPVCFPAVLFTNLEKQDPKRQLYKDLYLVAKIFRSGHMLPLASLDTSKKGSANAPNSVTYKRPFACGVLGLSNIMSGLGNPTEDDQVVRLYSGAESDYFLHHDLIAKKQTNKLTLMSNSGLRLGVHIIPGLVTQKEGLKNLFFSERLKSAACRRNEFRLTVESGEWDKSTKGTPKNLAVSMQYMDETGKPQHSGIRRDCTDKRAVEEVETFLVYHCNTPMWGETISVCIPDDIPVEKLCKSHVRFLLWHSSAKEKGEKKLLGFSYFPLFNAKGAAASNGIHWLQIYKCDDLGKLKDPLRYISLPWQRNSTQESSPNASFQVHGKDFIKINTFLVSSKLTQNQDLLSLLKWRSHPDFLADSLLQLEHVDVADIFSFLPHVLDTLFSLLATDSGKMAAHSDMVFSCLVHILYSSRHSSTGKSGDYEYSLTEYVNHQFSSAQVYRVLITLTIKKIGQFRDNEIPSSAKQSAGKSIPVLDFLVLFIVRSRELQLKYNDQIESIEWFNKRLGLVLNEIVALFSTNVEEESSEKILFLQFGAKLYTVLLKLWTNRDVALNLMPLFHSFHCDLGEQSLLNTVVLNFTLEVVRCQIFQDYNAQSILLKPVANILSVFLAQKVHLEICTLVLVQMLKSIHEKSKLASSQKGITFSEDLSALTSTILGPLVDCLLNMDRNSLLMGELFSCLFELLHMMDAPDYQFMVQHLRSLGGHKRLKDFLFRLFLIFHDCLRSSSDTLIPFRWRTLKLRISNTVLLALQELSEVLCDEFMENEGFDYQLWSKYFNLCASFVTQPVLQLEQQSAPKALAIMEKYEDMRVLMCFQFASLWTHLGPNQSLFCQSIVGPLLEISLTTKSEVRLAGLPLFFNLFEMDYARHGTLKQVESAIVEKIDISITEGRGDMEYRALFTQILTECIQKEELFWENQALEVVKNVSDLLEMLLEYRTVLQNPDYTGKKMACLLNLANFYHGKLRNDEMHCRYISTLHDLLVSSGYYVEAGGALQLHADLLAWGRNTLCCNDFYPTQLEWQRKEMIYENMLSHYDTGQCWERCIELCKHLAEFYEKEIFDYKKLSAVYHMMADMYQKILTDSGRPEPSYFRVAFYGQNFPSFVKNKVFIYRGHPFEKISHFCLRLMCEWPKSSLLPFGASKDDTLAVANTQYIEICNVKPSLSTSCILNSFDAPDNVKKHYRVNEVDSFEYVRPLSSNKRDSEMSRPSEFQNLWTEKITIGTYSKLPCAVPWTEVSEEVRETISPVQNACFTVREKNIELKRLLEVYGRQTVSGAVRKSSNESNQPLLMVLKGTIEAAVNGGITMYEQAFFTPDFVPSPVECLNLQDLRILIWEQLQLLERCLNLSAQLVSDECIPLQKHLVQCFDDLRRDMKKTLDSPQLRRVSGGSFTKCSLPSTPESVAVVSFPSGSKVKERKRRHTELSSLPDKPETGMSSSWDATMATQSGTEDESDENFCTATCDNSDDQRILLCTNGLSGGPPRPLSVHWDSSIEDIGRPKSVQGNLSDSNLHRHLGKAGSRDYSPGRLRKIMQRFSSATIGSSKSPSGSPRVSVDSGIERESSSGNQPRSRSPRWARKFNSPFSLPQHHIKSRSYQPLGDAVGLEDDEDQVERISGKLDNKTQDGTFPVNNPLPVFKLSVRREIEISNNDTSVIYDTLTSVQ